MPGPTGPKLKAAKAQTSVYLPPEMWAELTEAAEFHTAAFKAAGSEQKLSRNDMIESFLAWALEEYWVDKGGKPTTKAEWADKAKRHGEVLRSLEAKK